MNVNMVPAYLLAGTFAVASLHLAVELVLGVRRWWRRRMAEPVYTYGVLWPNGDLDDITRHDYQALIDQGYDELTDAYDHPEAYWDAWVEDALRMGHDTPTYDRLICEQYERDFRGDQS